MFTNDTTSNPSPGVARFQTFGVASFAQVIFALVDNNGSSQNGIFFAFLQRNQVVHFEDLRRIRVESGVNVAYV